MPKASASRAAGRGLQALGWGSDWSSRSWARTGAGAPSALLEFELEVHFGAHGVLLGFRRGLDPWAGAPALGWGSD